MFGKNDEQIDMRGLTRLGLWGAAATGALLIAVLAMQSDTGTRRVAGVLNADTPGASQLASLHQVRAQSPFCRSLRPGQGASPGWR